MADTTVSIKSMTDDTATVAGYGVIFGGTDLEGETFASDTNYMLDLVPDKLVMYDHSMGDVGHTIGKVATGDITVTSDGLWIEAQLDRHAEYVDAVLELVEAGSLGWSSGSIGHLTRREGKSIKQWPIVEFSLTPTPAEPRTVGVERIKQVSNHPPEAKAKGPASKPADADAGADVAIEIETDNQPMEDMKMSDERTEDTTQADAITALTEQVSALAGAFGEVKAKLDAEPPVKHEVKIVEDEADGALKKNPFRGLGDFLMSVKNVPLGNVDQRLLPLKSGDPMDEGGFSLAHALGDGFVGSLTKSSLKAAGTGLSETIPADGGFLVGTDRSNSILQRVYESGQLLSRVAMTGIGPNANGMTFYADAETARTAGNRHGGVRGYWMAENSAITASSPTFRVMEMKLRKAAALVYATDELLADSSALESYVMALMPEEIRFIVEDSIINGSGTGQPAGILNGNAVVSVAAETGQAATTFVAENAIAMWTRLWGRSQQNAIWLINQDVQPQLYQMSLPVGTGGQLVYTPPGGLSASPYGSLFGRPVIVHESCATLGTVGDVILVDPTAYQMIEKGGIESASSIHVRFTQGEQVFRFVYRVDGQPMWNAALTPLNGTNTVSPYVTVATRS